jgi:predicted nucleic acid-binding protein
MPEPREIVINTGPLIALVAALGDLRILRDLYSRVLVPFEVGQELLAGDAKRFAAAEFQAADWLDKKEVPIPFDPLLRNIRGAGETGVIQSALAEKVPLVAIDETVGRRIARLNGLQVTGSLGILMRARREGLPIVLTQAIQSMRDKGIWLGKYIEDLALREAGERQ